MKSQVSHLKSIIRKVDISYSNQIAPFGKGNITNSFQTGNDTFSN